MAGDAFILPNAKHAVSDLTTSTVTQLHSKIDGNDNALSGEETTSSCRRGFIGTSFGLGVVSTGLILLSGSQPAFAAAAANQGEVDKAKIVKGYQRLQYLLENWEKETTVCGMGGDKLERSCDRTPMKVMEYMGYRSTTDPLYKAEKTLRRLYEDAPINPKADAEFIEAVEVFAENADEASGMAL